MCVCIQLPGTWKKVTVITTGSVLFSFLHCFLSHLIALHTVLSCFPLGSFCHTGLQLNGAMVCFFNTHTHTHQQQLQCSSHHAMGLQEIPLQWALTIHAEQLHSHEQHQPPQNKGCCTVTFATYKSMSASETQSRFHRFQQAQL